MSPATDECQYTNAKDLTNRDKNRYSNILPGVWISFSKDKPYEYS